MEQQLIKKYRSNEHEYGYNCTDGGEGARGFKASEETRRLMSSMRQGVNAPAYGLHMSDAAKSSISKKLTGRTFSSSTRSLMSRAKGSLYINIHLRAIL